MVPITKLFQPYHSKNAIDRFLYEEKIPYRISAMVDIETDRSTCVTCVFEANIKEEDLLYIALVFDDVQIVR
jgi:hypothetical protein